MFKNTYHKRSQLLKGIEHLHSLYDSKHYKQHLLFSELVFFFFFFFFLLSGRTSLVGRNIKSSEKMD